MGFGADGRSRLASLFVEHHDGGQEEGMQGADVSKGLVWDGMQIEISKLPSTAPASICVAETIVFRPPRQRGYTVL